MKKNKKYAEDALNEEEKDILESFEKGEWKTVPNLKKEKALARKQAISTIRKNVRINIRLSEHDVLNIKQKAAYEGLPYQTLISSVLHKYASGHPGF